MLSKIANIKTTIILTVMLLGVLFFGFMTIKNLKSEKTRLQSNQKALIQKVVHYRAKDSTSVAVAKQIELSSKEMKNLYENELKEIRKKLDINARKIESITHTSTSTTQTFYTNTKDSMIYDSIPVKVDLYFDKWLTYERIKPINIDKSYVKYTVRDSLITVVYWSRDGFFLTRFFKRKGYEIIINSLNPNTQINYLKSINVKRKKK